MKRLLPLVPLAAFGIVALAMLGRLGAMESIGSGLLTVAIEGATVALVWGGAMGLGRLVARAFLGGREDPLASSRAPAAARFALEGGLGFSALMTLVHLLGLIGLVKGPVVGVLLLGGVFAALAGRDLKSLLAHGGEFLSHPAVALAAPLAAVLLVAASFPPGQLWPREAAGYDALEYHLQIPREWLAAGAIRATPHNVYGYLPLNLEVLSLGLFALRGGAYEGMLAVQWLHASFALTTAALLGLWAAARTGSRVSGAIAAAAYLAIPWNLVTGSLAYNEQAAAFLGLAAFVLLWEAPLTHRVIAAAGVCAGAAIGTKLTAAGFLFVPAIAAFVLLRDREEGAAKTAPKRLALAVLVFGIAASLVHLPYLVRNAAWTHNPVFPFATRVLGRAHWGEAEEWRWINGHFPRASAGERVVALWKNGLGDEGFGWPLLVAAAGLALALSRRPTRALAAGVAVFAGMQLLFWISATHLQPRFLQPLTVPLALAAGLGAAALPARAGWPAVIAMALGATCWHGALLARATDSARPAASDLLANPMTFADTLEGPLLKDHHPLLVGEARAFYFPAGSSYADPFEVSPFAAAWRAAGGDPARVLGELRKRRIDLVIINWDEVDRLGRTYGLDAEINADSVARLIGAGARRIPSPAPHVDILEIPAR